jgi:ParB-like chromosome segregation protein Spo0J
MTEITVRIEAVRVESRFRRDMGDLEGLAASIKREGLINAITVTPDMYLLAGERRLEAVRRLGWTEIAARVVDTLEDAAARLRFERDENTERKPMTPEELVALGEALEALERPRAAARKAMGQALGGRATASWPVGHEAGDVASRDDAATATRDVVAAAIGMSATSYRRAKTVVAAANDPTLDEESRRVAQEALAEMNATGKISGSYDRVSGDIRSRTGSPTSAPEIVASRHQRKAISSAATKLAGICDGLERINELHPDITCEEAAQWVGSLSESRRIITVLVKHLKERTNDSARA